MRKVPDYCRRANIVPLFKMGKKEGPSNYRLVSLTSIPGKILEQIIKESLCKDLENKAIITRSKVQVCTNPARLNLSHVLIG